MATEEHIASLEQFGATEDAIVPISDAIDHRHLDYLDLTSIPAKLPKVSAVVEMAGRAVLYAVRGPLSAVETNSLCHLLAQRGAADYLGILQPGELTVVPLLRSAKQRKEQPSVWRATDASSRNRLPSLAFGTSQEVSAGTGRRLHDELFKMLTHAASTIVDAGVKEPEDALSLVGRALFLRFLMDRRIVSDQDVGEVCPRAGSLVRSMDTPAYVTATSQWLDDTFNGNLLPLSNGGTAVFWQRVNDKEAVCEALGKILTKSENTGQLRFAWDSLDFGHIPVGLLSQVYEKWCHQFARSKAIQDSVWYTPRAIAEYMVDEAFYGLDKPHAARVLDPAVGAGVFLVAAYRELVAARWEHDQKRPTRRILREILYKQLTGFDINEASLRLTALGLYLTALELDPTPSEKGHLRFNDLRECGVLHDVRGPLDLNDENELPKVGSLGPHISSRHNGAYDVVIGNPPWTSWTTHTGSGDPEVKQRRRLVEQTLTPLLQKRLSDADISFEMVDSDPDLPFCWRATEWARPGGVIAFALHSRLLFRHSGAGNKAREFLFRGITITGILNGAALAPTQVWPSHTAPFCLLFAANDLPTTRSVFRFVSPVTDDALNSQGHLRIDPSAARPVSQSQAIKNPSLLKTLYRGHPIDVEVMSRMLESCKLTLGEYWDAKNLGRARGYIEGGRKSKKKSVHKHLRGLPDLTTFKGETAYVRASHLPRFTSRPLWRGLAPEALAGPIVLTFEAPRHDQVTPRSLYSRDSVAYNHVFYGHSTQGHEESVALAKYLLVVLNSSLFLYHTLMRSAMFGVDRNRFLQSDFDDFPFVPLEELTARQRARANDIAQRLLDSPGLPQDRIDLFVGSLYGLNDIDTEVVRDTVETALPFSYSRERAQARPEEEEIQRFVKIVSDLLAAALQYVHRELHITPLNCHDGDTWIMLRIHTRERTKARGSAPPDPPRAFLDDVWKIALETGATRILLPTETPGELVVGIFAQYRYWTPTQARSLAVDLLSPSNEPWLRGQTR